MRRAGARVAFTGALALALLACARPASAQLNLTVGATQTGMVVQPGAANVTLLNVTIDNGNPLAGATLSSIVFTHLTSGAGAGTVAQRDAELGTARLFRDDGDGVPEPAQDTPLRTATAAGGKLTFSALNTTVPAGGSVRLFVMTTVALNARDGDALDLSLNAASDLTFVTGQTYTNSFPLSPAGSFPIDGMVAAQITPHPVAPGTVLAGSTNRLALDVTLPANGYQADVLEKLSVTQSGNALAGSEITAVRAFADNGNGVFDPATDAALGTLAFTGGNRWQLTGLNVAVPAAGLRAFVAVDVSDLATEGHTIQLRIPTTPDPGVGMSSGNDGPMDFSSGEISGLVISTADRVAWSAVALPSGTVLPGTKAVPLARWTATNKYSGPRTLNALGVANLTRGSGTPAERDGEIELLALRADGDGDGVLDGPATDPVLATATFVAGRASFSNFSWTLAAGATGGLFLAADVSAALAADGDTLGAQLAGPSDLGYDTSTRAVGNWPLDSGARRAIDGMAAASIARFATPGGTLGQGDGPVLAFDAILPRNGYRDDVLQRVRLQNLGDAVGADFASVRLWRDGGDGVFSAGGGDDQDLGPASYLSGSWISAVLAEPLGAGGARIFAGFTVAGAPNDSATLRLEIPIAGLQLASANDGPMDRSVDNPNTLLLSNSPLLAGLVLTPAASTLGQLVTLRMQVRNTGADSILGVSASAPIASGTGAFSLLSGPTPATLALAAGDVDTVTWTYTAASAGSIAFTAYASGFAKPGAVYRRSLDAASNTHQVFDQADSLAVSFASTLPASVNRGQAGVGVLNLALTSAGGPQSAPVRVTRLTLRLEDGTGAGLVPAALLTQATVATGGNPLLTDATPEASGSELVLALATPLLVGPSTTTPLTVRFSIASGTLVTNFRAVLVDAAALAAEDANSGAPIAIRFTGGAPPFATSLARVVAGATQVQAASLDTTPLRAGRGQHDVPVFTLRLTSPGTDGITSDVQVNALSFELRDTTQALVARPADVLERVRIRNGSQVLAVRTLTASDGPALAMLLSPALILPVNTLADLVVEADLAPGAIPGGFVLVCGDTSTFEAEDRNTRDPVPAAYASDPLAGRRFVVERTADTLRVSGTPRFPTSVRIGDTQVPVLRVRFAHPGLPGTARIRVDSLTFFCGDASHAPRVPANYLARLRVNWNGAPLADVLNPPASGATVTAVLPGPMLEPGDTALVDVTADIAPGAPAGSLELRVFASGLHAVDANLGSALVMQAPASTDLPLSSGVTQLQSPARDLFASLASAMPAALAGDGTWVPLGTLTLRNGGAAGSGAIRVDHLVLRAAGREFGALAAGGAMTEVAALIADTVWAANSALTTDSLEAGLFAIAPLDVPAGGSVAIALQARLRVGREGTSLRGGFDAAGIGVVQPGSALLQVAVRPEAGGAFPLWTEAGSFGALSLAGSYSNFPNPFAGGRETTSFAYYLAAPASVSLRIVTLGGESVVRILDRMRRTAGLQQSDRWDGRNGAGLVVRNGVYLAELVATYDDGRSERSLRKIAVVR